MPATATPAQPDLAAALALIAQAIENPPAPAIDLDSALDPLHDDLRHLRQDLGYLETDLHALRQRKPALLVIDRDGNPFGGELPAQRHPQLETLLRAISARDVSGARLNVWIAGPAGSGKTHAAKQCAQALGLTFGFHGAMTYAHDLVGFVDAGGRYHETQFVKLYRDGGLCLLDELDSGTSEALLTLNAALANGQIATPNGQIITRHPDFACIGAANTFGAGATAEYVGRNKLDAAFLSRFPVKLSWAYDLELESAICGNPDWAQEVQAARAKAQAAGLKIVIDPRHSIAGAALIAAGMDRAQVAELTYLAGLKPEQVTMLKVKGGAK
jgi:cobaltochelatase CobS